MKLSPLLLALALLGGCQRPPPADAPAVLPAASVQARAVATQAHPQTRLLTGIVRPYARATVAARVMGTVTKDRLAVGLEVQAGEFLVQLDAGEITAQFEQAQAALALAQRNYDRETSLAAKGAAAADHVRLAADQLRIARARVDEAEVMVAYTTVSAPFAGVITADLVNLGDLATLGQPLFSIEGHDQLRAEVPVPESFATLPTDSPIVIELAGHLVTGRLVEMSPAADAATRTRLAKIALPADSGARSGQFARAYWPNGNAIMFSIPRAALQTHGQLERVFVIADGRAHLRLVRSGAALGDEVQIFSGLSAGETVIVNPPADLRDGQLVRVTP
ncbi:MAG: efflux RND transporter periplasmic adaptor subunit [Opitutaceae bacterium]|nr:efflux RND transporter periplasmic adaptor subunit [Opitutaceae bacterium]